MEIAITGHTSGIGKYIFENYRGISGFSRSNGYNICKSDDRKRILQNAENCDVFINNAHNEFGQTFLLLDIFKKWQFRNKTIVNIGSRVAEDGLFLANHRMDLMNYRIYKSSLKSLHEDLAQCDTSLTLNYVWFGYVGTERIFKKYPDLQDYISVEQAATEILKPLQKE
jgi:hypothetical protein